MFVEGNIGGTSAHFLLDTRAKVTIINPNVYYGMPEDCRPPLEEVKTRMVLADGRSVPFWGRNIFTLTVDGRELEQEVWVASIDVEGILGMDFIQRHGCGLVPKDGRLRLTFPAQHKEEFIEAATVSPKCCKVEVERSVSVPAGNEVLVPGQMIGLAGLAEWREDDGDIALTGSGEGADNSRLSTTPAILTEHLFERSVEHLSDADLGRIGVGKHRIDTGDAHPIKQPARRIPMHMRSTVDEEERKILKRHDKLHPYKGRDHDGSSDPGKESQQCTMERGRMRSRIGVEP